MIDGMNLMKIKVNKQTNEENKIKSKENSHAVRHI